MNKTQDTATYLDQLGYPKADIDKFINMAWQVLREKDSTIPSDVLDAFKRVLQDNLDKDQYNKTSLFEWHELTKELPPFDKDGGRNHYSLLVQFPLGTVHEAVYYGDNRFYLDGVLLNNVVAWALLPRPYLALVQDPDVTMINQLKY